MSDPMSSESDPSLKKRSFQTWYSQYDNDLTKFRTRIIPLAALGVAFIITIFGFLYGLLTGDGPPEFLAEDPREQDLAVEEVISSPFSLNETENSGSTSNIPNLTGVSGLQIDDPTISLISEISQSSSNESGSHNERTSTIEISDIDIGNAIDNDIVTQRQPEARNSPVSTQNRAASITAYGGTKESEEAVGKALKWIADFQDKTTGGWSFNHCLANPGRYCSNPGDDKSLAGATGMALLPFLGAGQTHKDGKYKNEVYNGLRFLGSRMKNNGDLKDGGNMYAHAVASLALCEAYLLTEDKDLKRPAQAAIDFIVDAQDPKEGGWRYLPKQPGDTSATGWQIMALSKAHEAYIKVSPKCVSGAANFLNRVQASNGAYYGYTEPGQKASTTAVGLLSRIHLGWKKMSLHWL